MRNGFLCLLLAAFHAAVGQSISGRVTDGMGNQPLVGASIDIKGTEKGVVSDTDGHFRLDLDAPGRYELTVSYVGFATIKLNNVWVKTGKETILTIELKQEDQQLSEVTIVEGAGFPDPGRLTITEEQINRFASTYYDPARLLMASPDVAIANDQNNLISVRGIPPEFNTWTLEKAEIVNPNHLSNAGTFLDQPVPTGGGVNVLSAQMLDRSAFLYGAFDNSYGNSVGGIFDMQLKTGNSEENQYTAQASLIGLDLFSEGPIRKGGQAAYAANYRYSFTGLLTHMGVDFGGESIGFQDLAITGFVPVGQNNRLKIFGVGGMSFNHFDHLTFENSEREKDRSDIYYDNKTGVVGASLSSAFADSKWTNTWVVSGYENKRNQVYYDNGDLYANSLKYRDRYTICSGITEFEKRFTRLKTTLGTAINIYSYFKDQGIYFDSDIPSLRDRLVSDQVFSRSYLDLEHQVTGTIKLNYGLTYGRLWSDAEGAYLDPRGELKIFAGTHSAIRVSAGSFSQVYQPFNKIFSGMDVNGFSITDDRVIRSFRYTATYEWFFRNLRWSAELFHYQYPKVQTYLGSFPFRTSGVSMTVEKAFNDGLYFRMGGSYFDAPVKGSTVNRYNTQFSFRVAGGKEWVKTTEKKNSAFGINIRATLQGGQNIAYLELTGINNQNRAYFRPDIRLQWVRYRTKYTRIIAIDVQNALNIQNDAYPYYDDFLGRMEKVYQLGLIPIFTYRVEW